MGWEPGTPVNTLEQVWDYLSRTIRECKLQLSRVESRYYGRHRDAESHCRFLCSELRQDSAYSAHRDSYNAVKERLRNRRESEKDNLSSELLNWLEDVRMTKECLKELSRSCQMEIFLLLTTYCSSYFPVLGANNDKLFTLYRSKIFSVKKTMKRIQEILENMDNPQANVEEMESLQCECQGGHTLTKVIPLLIDDFEQFLDKSYDWLTIDKCYMDEIKESVANSRKQLQKLEKQCKLSTGVYNSALLAWRQEKMVLDSLNSELAAFSLRELREVELRGHRVDLEIRALEQTLAQIEREEVADDVPDCCLDQFEEKSSTSTDRLYYQQR